MEQKLLPIIICLIAIILIKNLNNLEYIKNKLINKIKEANLEKYFLNLKTNFLIDNNSKKDDNTEDEEELSASEETLNIVNKLHTAMIDKKSKIYFDISIDNKKMGRIVFKLFTDIVPKTCKNVLDLCKNKAYKNNKFHRLVKDFCIQGGDITNNDGNGGISIYGNKFDDENFKIKHDRPGIISMANSGPNTNNSQFFITFQKISNLDNKHVAFGEIIDGLDKLKELNTLNSINEEPNNNIIIEDCGVL